MEVAEVESVKKTANSLQDNIMKFSSMISIRGSAHPSCAAKGLKKLSGRQVLEEESLIRC